MRRTLLRRGRAARRQFLDFFRPLRIESLEDRALLTLTPQLVADINQSPIGVKSSGPIVEVNGVAYFSGNDGIHGPELWRSDGTTSGTSMVKDIRPAGFGSLPFGLTNINGTLFFRANDGFHGYELWKSDGTPSGTVMVKDITPGAQSSGSSLLANQMANAGGMLLFAYNDGAHGYELWKSDGTEVGTTLIKDIRTVASSNPTYLTEVSGIVYFQAADDSHGYELWKSDGTPGGTVMVNDIITGATSSVPSNLTNVNGTLFFAAYDATTGNELWKSDGSPGGTTQVKDIRTGANLSSGPGSLTNVNGTLFFQANDGTTGIELWKSDGSPGGTMEVKDIRPLALGSNPKYLTNVNGTVFFQADDGTTGAELWKSDGTPDGTMRVADIRTGSISSNPNSLTAVGGTLFFSANDGSGNKLWRSDGTGGTTAVSASLVSLQFLSNVSGTLFFNANRGSGFELWKSDGTQAGTALATPFSAPSLFNGFTSVGGLAYFNADDGVHSGGNGSFPILSQYGGELWKTDGTAAGTALVADIRPGNYGSKLSYLTNVGGTLFFSANDGSTGTRLWKSDGTQAGTVPVSTSAKKPNLAFTNANMNGTLFFNGTDGASGYELWKSDGTDTGTMLVKDIRPGSGNSNPAGLTNVSGTLFFTANDGASGFELWKSDGTGGGTKIVKDIMFAAAGSYPSNLINVNGRLFFTANDGATGIELWTSDGTNGGTNPVADIAGGSQGSNPQSLTNMNGTLFFTSYDGVTGTQLWKSDGTQSGTARLTFANIGAGGTHPLSLTNVNGTLFFVANDGISGYELWKSDGTVGGTALVKDIAPGSINSSPSALANVDGVLFFQANDGTHGIEPWKSDGTAAGTIPLADIAPGSAPSNAFDFTFLNGRMIFFADDGVHGYEPWSMLLDDYGDAPDTYGTTFVNNGARHLSVGPQLGPLRDAETDATPSTTGMAADDDGLVAASLLAGGSSSVTVNVVSNTGVAKLDAWIDFNQDGVFSASEQILLSRSVPSGISQIPISVPLSALAGPTVARFRISTAGGLGPTGSAPDGEVEDHLLTVAQDLVVNLPTASGNDNVSIRKNGADVEVFDLDAATVIASSPLAFTNSLIVNGSPSNSNQVTIDYALGDFFSLPGGIQLNGGANVPNSLSVYGVYDTTVQYVSQGLSLGNAALETQLNGSSNEIRISNFTYILSAGPAFEVSGTLRIDSGEYLGVGSPAPLKLSTLTILSGGTLDARTAGIALGTGDTLRGSGTVTGPVAADIGSLIDAQGTLTLGDSSSPAGFATRGELYVGNSTVTLLDSNQAVLGSLTSLGESNIPGTLNSANGVVVDFGNNITGFGTVNTPNDVLKLVTNNGSISGDSATKTITLPGFIKGVGSLNNVTVTGTNSPGFSPATVYYGGASYGPTGKLIAEIGGTTAGSFDQQNYSGIAGLDGTLDIELINNFAPYVGNSFTLINASGGITGTFNATTLPTLPKYWYWKLNYGANALTATIGTTHAWYNSLKPLDVNNDGHIFPNDALAVINYINAFGSKLVPPTANYAPPFLDTSGDNDVAPNDALKVINVINAGLAGEGEANPASQSPPLFSQELNDLITMLATDSVNTSVSSRSRPTPAR
jgi:ELWxxDGT repeat protein